MRYSKRVNFILPETFYGLVGVRPQDLGEEGGPGRQVITLDEDAGSIGLRDTSGARKNVL
jgi:hypothetical protein